MHGFEQQASQDHRQLYGQYYLHDTDWVVCLAEADDCMQDGLLHGVILGLGLAQASCQSMLCLPLLQ